MKKKTRKKRIKMRAGNMFRNKSFVAADWKKCHNKKSFKPSKYVKKSEKLTAIKCMLYI